MKKPANNGAIYWIIGIIIALVLVSSYYSANNEEIEEVSLSEIAAKVENEEIEEIVIKDNLVVADIKEDGKVQAYKEPGVGLNEYGITSEKTKITVEDTSGSMVWYTLLSTLLPILLIGGFIWFMLRSASGANTKAMSFGKSSAKLAMGSKTTFDEG